MNLVSFNNSFSKVKDILKEFGLLKMSGIKNINNDGVSDEFKRASIKNSYFKTYTTGLENYDYDFLLSDQSFFQFQFREVGDKVDLRYSFFQNPIEYIDYPNYVENQILKFDLEESVEEIGMLLEEEYNQFLNEQELISNFTTIRCDVDYPNYKPLIHSVSHLHIGHNNNIRIPLDKIISPVKFVLFVLKQVYYREWKSKVESNNQFIVDSLIKCKEGELLLNNHNFQIIEKNDPYLT